MVRVIARWWALVARERPLLLGLMAGLPVIAASMRLLGVMRTRRLLERMSVRSIARRAQDAELCDAQRLAQLTSLAARRGLIRATCLHRALLVHWILRRRGFAPELKLGVRRDAGVFAAHAWIELQGVALGDGGAAYQPFAQEVPRDPPRRMRVRLGRYSP